ncbi:hypothetical protein [Arthrobacter sp. PM3]|uniref:hypothetical protein n=1 Tax=Arthrobacter sp. PM3 TaxID=2017685 RepID=UPI000E1086DF|nr:hypothetical protein [Arthrobacter sp. PM3]AXJ09296.1 hypothetical protein CFN17_06440 [Arthrobacter sp. PM3]
MFLHNLGWGLLRRWYFALAGILITAAGALFVWTAVPPSYQATSTAVLLPPSSLVGEKGNPYLYMGGLEQALTVLTVRLRSAEVEEPLIQGRGDLSYLVEKDPASPGPVMLITATAGSQASAMELLEEVVKVIPANLAVMQDQLRIPTFNRVEVMTVVQDHTAVLLIKDQLRVLLAAVAGGLAVTVLVTALLDRVLTSRRKKRDEHRIQASNQVPALLPEPETPNLESQPTARRRAAGASKGNLGNALARDQEFEIPTATSNP